VFFTSWRRVCASAGGFFAGDKAANNNQNFHRENSAKASHQSTYNGRAKDSLCAGAFDL
jgi:hypothetical protein